MLLYAVQVEIDEAVAEGWRRWMNYTHIPEVIGTGYFRGYRFGEVMDPAPLGSVASSCCTRHRISHIFRLIWKRRHHA